MSGRREYFAPFPPRRRDKTNVQISEARGMFARRQKFGARPHGQHVNFARARFMCFLRLPLNWVFHLSCKLIKHKLSSPRRTLIHKFSEAATLSTLSAPAKHLEQTLDAALNKSIHTRAPCVKCTGNKMGCFPRERLFIFIARALGASLW